MITNILTGLSEEETVQFKRDWAVATPARKRIAHVLRERKKSALDSLVKTEVDSSYAIKMASLTAEVRKLDELLKIVEKSL